ncbi:MAG: hypothetical protein MHPSP_001956, partial [Paramarteilia canceri]
MISYPSIKCFDKVESFFTIMCTYIEQLDLIECDDFENLLDIIRTAKILVKSEQMKSQFLSVIQRINLKITNCVETVDNSLSRKFENFSILFGKIFPISSEMFKDMDATDSFIQLLTIMMYDRMKFTNTSIKWSKILEKIFPSDESLEKNLM